MVITLTGFLPVISNDTTTLAEEVSDNDVPDDVFVRFTLEVYHRTRYQARPRHKAIAIGPHGFWHSAYGHRSKSTATQTAIEGCQKLLTKSRFKSIRKRKCHLYAVDDEIVFKGKLPKLPLGTALTGEDIPLKKALYDRSPEKNVRGILLLLHGCNRIRAFSKKTKRWFRYFQSKGFRVIVPNSFAERRPQQQCTREIRRLSQQAQLRRGPVIVRVVHLRAAQTHRTLRVLEARYPNLPILIWGQSEGGGVAQLVTSKVAGVLATGIECGIRGARALLVRSDVPLLVLIGNKDPWIRAPKKLTPDNVTDYCNKVLYSVQWDFVYLKGEGHFPSIRNRAVREAVDEFIERALRLHSSPSQ